MPVNAPYNNLAELSEHQARIEAMHAALVAEVGQDPYLTEQQCRGDYSKDYKKECLNEV